MKPSVNRFILCRILRWKITPGEDSLPVEKKALFLFAPHTSFYDFVVGYLYFRSLGGKLHVMIKKEAFKGLFGKLLRKLGGFPIDRSHSQGTMVQLIHAVEESDSFYLCICPEGTRKAVRRWKSGYHTIATQTGMPVFLAHADFKKREVGYGRIFPLGNDPREDTLRIQAEYAKMHLTACHPEGYVTN